MKNKIFGYVTITKCTSLYQAPDVYWHATWLFLWYVVVFIQLSSSHTGVKHLLKVNLSEPHARINLTIHIKFALYNWISIIIININVLHINKKSVIINVWFLWPTTELLSCVQYVLSLELTYHILHVYSLPTKEIPFKWRAVPKSKIGLSGWLTVVSSG